jgi:glycine dehydrogenase subunit 1
MRVAELPAHPYIPNSAPETRDAMLAELGLTSLDELFDVLPDRLRARDPLELPPSLAAEADLARYFREALAENRSCEETLSFLGGGCWQHHVPAVCDEIASRGELYTAFFGLGPGSTYGAYQAIFEYQSLMAELVGLPIGSVPTYDWGWAASIGLLMAVRVTGRRRVLVARSTGPQRRSQIAARMPVDVELTETPFDGVSGGLNIEALRAGLEDAAALYLEVPSYFGVVEPDLRAMADLVHDRGALLVVGADPISLGVVAPPGEYGADIACGDLQPLGSHMAFGGSGAGFLSTRLDERLVAELPAIYIAAFPTDREGEHDFFWGNFEATSYETRGTATDFTGCSSALTAIVAATYLAAMGPQGMRELGEGLLRRRAYATSRLAVVPGLAAPRFSGPGVKELVVDFGPSGATVEEVNAGLLERGIFGGASLAHDYPELGESALYCITELHTRGDIDRLGAALEEVLR